jgi:phosphatidate cytidylyltransferase
MCLHGAHLRVVRIVFLEEIVRFLSLVLLLTPPLAIHAHFGLFLSVSFHLSSLASMIVAMLQVLLFRELVKVRYNVHFNTIEDTIPLFRTTQWMWFSVSVFYTYGDFIFEVIQSNQQLHGYLGVVRYGTSVAFILYSGTFVLTIATMQVGHIKFQLNQLCWTIVVLCLTVGQMKYIMYVRSIVLIARGF